MREIIESGFKVSLPKDLNFRFCEMPVYQSLSGKSLKEMDLGWWDEVKGRLILLELRGNEIWDGFDIHLTAGDYLVSSLTGKANDVLLMLAAAWSETELGLEIKSHLPNNARRYNGEGSLKLIFLIDTPVSRKPLLLPVKDELNRIMAGRTRLFGVNHITIVDFDTAVKMGLPVEKEIE